MLFVRFASQIVFIKCEKDEIIEHYLINDMKGLIKDYKDAVRIGDEASTVVFLKEKDKIGDSLKNENVIFLKKDIRFVMKEMINWNDRELIHKLDMAPSIILMRYIENGEKAYKEIENRYHSKRVEFHEALKMDSEKYTIVALTKKPLSMSVNSLELINPPVVVQMPSLELFRELRNDVLLYLAKTANGRDWYELNITVYSKEGNYKGHCERLIHVLNDLGIVLILHEGWTIDHPFVLVTVAVYQVTVLSLIDPIEVKKILLGIEYNKNGGRVVDIDLFHKKKKISWTERGIKEFGKDRTEIGMHFRKELISKLPHTTARKYIE